MRTSPSIAPHGPEQDTYLVLDDFGGQARMFLAREALGNGRPARSEYRGPRYVLGFSNEKAG